MYLGMTKYWFLETKTYTKAAIPDYRCSKHDKRH